MEVVHTTAFSPPSHSLQPALTPSTRFYRLKSSQPTRRNRYLRRLRTLADKYYGSPSSQSAQSAARLRQIIDETWARVAPAAARDNAVWGRGDGGRGYRQLTTEFIPIRCGAGPGRGQGGRR